MLRGKGTNKAEAFVFDYYLELTTLLQIGIPYTSIIEMSDEEIEYILTMHRAISEIQEEKRGNQ